MMPKSQASIPPDLPISLVSQEILEAIDRHQVVIVAGETGSGKSTQLPKLCLALGRGQAGLIGCTQPRRIAARSVARRVAEELSTELGQRIGFQVRFSERVSESTQVKFMTDGILLAEIHADRLLKRYDTLIIDEAHERSLNIDFLLGYLKTLLPQRPDLKLIITSATINTEQFSDHFNQAPIITVEGRGYPVDVKYQVPREGEEVAQQIKRAIDQLNRIDARGDILVFLPGEREIFQVAKVLRKASLAHTEILPLYARLPAEYQDAIFKTGVGRRVVLATNVAETSLTVPGIRFVIDTGLARISRYAAHSKVLRLPIEPISQAACEQRAGRCGRVGPGTCIRLFDEADFLTRKPYTEPEIQRSSLVGVILQMRSLQLGEPEIFPFIDKPPSHLLGEAWQALYELQAVDAERNLTPIGKTLAQLPIDAKYGRMMIEACNRHCLNEAIVLVAAMSISDVRDRPLDQQQAADAAHAQFYVKGSDFLTQLGIWAWWQATRQSCSTSQANKLARANFLAPNRLHEWAQLVRQLREMTRQQRWDINSEPVTEAEAIHRSLLAGLLSMVGRLEDQGRYMGVRGHQFRIFPGSVLSKAQPDWIMSAERVDTGQTYARMVAAIQAEWLEQQASHLIKRRVFDPYWSRRQGRVLGFEQLSLHGLVLVPKRRIHFGPHDPKQARDIFILHALARGEMNFSAEFSQRNEALKALLAQHEHKQRRRDLLVSDEAVASFFDKRLPDGIYTTKDFAQWFQCLDERERSMLLLGHAELLREEAGLASDQAFPDTWKMGNEQFVLHYQFEPGTESDGITLDCPLHLINQLDEALLEWLVPGMREEKVAALISSLPKSKRRLLVPIKEYAKAAIEALGEPEGSLLERLSHVLSKMSGLQIGPEDFKAEKLPQHLLIRVRVMEATDSVLGSGRDIGQLKSIFGQKAKEQFMARQSKHWQQDGLAKHQLQELPQQVTTPGGHQAWPAWVKQDLGFGVRLFDSWEDALEAHRHALIALCRGGLIDKIKYIRRNHGLSPASQVAWATQGSVDDLVESMVDMIIGEQVDGHGVDQVRNLDQLGHLMDDLRRTLVEQYQALASTMDQIIIKWHQCVMRANELYDAVPTNISDVLAQLEDLIYPGFVDALTKARVMAYPRYLKAVEIRLDGLSFDPKKDSDRLKMVQPFWDRYLTYLQSGNWYTESLDSYRFALEEYRVQIFAQKLGTAEKVSPKRLEALWAEVIDENSAR